MLISTMSVEEVRVVEGDTTELARRVVVRDVRLILPLRVQSVFVREDLLVLAAEVTQRHAMVRLDVPLDVCPAEADDGTRCVGTVEPQEGERVVHLFARLERQSELRVGEGSGGGGEGGEGERVGRGEDDASAIVLLRRISSGPEHLSPCALTLQNVHSVRLSATCASAGSPRGGERGRRGRTKSSKTD
jgi:hypothetical protein